MESGHDGHDLFAGIDRLTPDQFRTEALHWLHGRIGFDGVIWGSGTATQDSALDVADCFLEGRPDGLLAAHAGFSTPDAFVPDFLSCPEALRNIYVAEYCQRAQLADLLDHLESYRVRHILLQGIRQTGQHALAWIGFLREDARQPFDPSCSSASGMAISVVLRAWEYTGLANTRLGARAECAAAGEEEHTIHLTDRQKQVLHCLLQGWPNKLIARRLEITENTLKTHLHAIYQSMHVSSRSQAILHAGKFVIHDNVDCGDFRYEL